jgi:hypothetical protein
MKIVCRLIVCRLIGHRYWDSVSWGSTLRHCFRCGHPNEVR